ncbi:MAG: hypothetical protein JW730_11230 [Anaerolineales bacterium]|nr:hypothetical protein [Anaerolineales bacterium]
MRFGWSAKDASVRVRGIAKIAAVIFIAIYIVIYLAEPFPDLWNDILIALSPVIAASLSAVVATMIWRRYEQTETPRRIWRYIAFGLWLWTAAELAYGYLDITQEEVRVGLPDVFWVAAYIFFAHALFIQYRLLANPSKQELWNRSLLAVLVLLAVYFLVDRLLSLWVVAENWVAAAVNSFYPVGDLFLALIAVWLIRHFRGGAFARPWLGLLAFSFTDFLYAWIDTSGIYDQANTLWTALFDTSYLGAYLILGLGLLSQWTFLKYGLRSSTSTE